MIRYWFKGLFLLMLSASTAFAENETRIDTNRGSMLYDNHCIQCHTQQVHWREKRLATDWKALITQVDRWQRASGLDWNNKDIEEVTRYLNGKYYHYP
jgi:mono/diheme cytochrome c family protein